MFWGVFLILLYLLVVIYWYVGDVGFAVSSLIPGFSFFSFFQDFKFDCVSYVCLLMLGMCGFIALSYCYHYFGGQKNALRLWVVMLLFIFVMGYLMLSGSLLLTLIGWEYLGLVSFFLILFYGNMASIRAALITLFASRFGDVSLFLIFGLVYHSCLAWEGWWFSVLFLLVVLTKSACFPFISWLLEAMRAPTPVSSLVHSSTLVAAGVWFLLRYCSNYQDSVSEYVFVLSMASVVITGISAFVFTDLKKIVALSTCNNICWCLVYFLNGFMSLALVQLITHGVCKCYLFMGVGDLMSSSGSSQHNSGIYKVGLSGFWSGVFNSFLIFSLCGLPFLGIFYSKHVLFGLGCSGGNSLSLAIVFVGFFLSYVYSMRFVLILLRSEVGLSVGVASSFWVVGLIAIGGGLYNYLQVEVSPEVGVSSFIGSLIFFFVVVVGCVTGILGYLYELGGVEFNKVVIGASVLGGCEWIVSSFYSIFINLISMSVLGFYRWEVCVLRTLGGFVNRKMSLFFVEERSINYAVLGLVGSLFLFIVLG